MARCEHCGGSGSGSGGYDGRCGYCDGTGSGACGECGYPSHRESPAECSSHGSQGRRGSKEKS